MDYLKWNDLICERFFHEECEGRRVYLSVSRSTIDKIADENDTTYSDFINAIKDGPPWANGSGICLRAISTFNDWRSKPLVFPPYIGYLAIFVLAAEVDVNYSARAYYPRLRQLLGEQPETGQYPHFDRMQDLWHDLEEWTIYDMDGNLGIYRATHSLGWVHVGFPLSQALLTAHERARMPEIFAMAGFDPSSPPADGVIVSTVAHLGRDLLRKITLDTLLSSDNQDEHQVMLKEMIAVLLSDWDGRVYSTDGDASVSIPTCRIPLILCLSIDSISKKASVNLRCRSKSLPETGTVYLDDLGDFDTVSYQQWVQNWSTLLVSSSGVPIDASQLNWEAGVSCTSHHGQYKYTLAPKSVRVFVDGLIHGLSGLIEINHIPTDRVFYLLVFESCRRDIEEWGTVCCTRLNQHTIITGLPNKWYLYEGESANQDNHIVKKYPILSTPKQKNLQLVGGMRISTGNKFLSIAPPKISINPSIENFTVLCNGNQISKSPIEGHVSVPLDNGSDSEVNIDLVIDNSTIQRERIRLVAVLDWRTINDEHWLDRFGALLTDKEICIDCYSGVDVHTECEHQSPLLVFPEIASDRRVYFLGRIPGQIVNWPDESIPDSWRPVWSISVGRGSHPSGVLRYCGHGELDSTPACNPIDDKRRLKMWIELVWHWRKRIVIPKGKAIKDLWKEYQRVSRTL